MISRALLSTTASLLAISAMPVQAQTQVPRDADVPTSAPAAESQVEQPQASPDTAAEADIVVTGIRASLRSAQAIKQNSGQIVDSIVAEDIGKLPDINVAEALQRITGVQIGRSQGEGASVAIRGLTQVRTELDGRTIFTSGGRDISLEDVPSELLAGADVFKSPAANQIEGGIGGLINLKLNKPLSFDGLKIAGQVRGTYYDYAEKVRPQVSALVSNRWDTGIGEIGILVSGAYQTTRFQTDSIESEAFNLRRDFVDLNGNGVLGEADDATLVPGGGGIVRDTGKRDRYGANVALQWRPNDVLEIHADGLYQRYDYRQDSDLLYIFANSADPNQIRPGGPATVYDGTNIFRSGTFANINAVSGPFTNDRTSTTWQLAGGFKYEDGPAKLTFDAAYTKAKTDSEFLQLRINRTVSSLFMDTSTGLLTLRPVDGEVDNPAAYGFESAARYVASNDGDEIALRLDGDFQIDSGFLSKMAFGVRYADRKTEDGSAYVYNSLSSFPQSALPEAFGFIENDFFSGSGRGPVDAPTRFVSPTVGLVRDFERIQRAFGLPVGRPDLAPLSVFNLTEKTLAAYAMGTYDFDVGGVKISGNAGVRVLDTDTSTVGNQVTPDGTTVPIAVGGSYVSVLPSFNIRFDFTDKLTLRGAAAKVLSRPGFGSLSPGLFLDGLFLTGNAGNPNLGPLTADQYDLSLEYYFTRNSFAYVAGFAKDVQGFIANVVAPETYNGQVYQISRPQNGDDGKIRGFEVGWNQFLDFLPGPLDGLGFQVNYTYVDSEAPGPLVGQTVPLEGLSRNSYNLVGIYEKGPASLRVAYNWRDSYVLTTAGPGTGSNPIYSKGGGFLDASASYDLNRNISLFAYGANLLRTPSQSYFDTELRPRSYSVTDRRITGGVRFSF